jgi:putative transposase
MPRLARMVVPSIPHHITQRGARRQQTFFSDDDYRLYRSLLRDWCAKAGTEIWGWCLMPNHVHLILVPSHVDGLRAALGEAHRRYTRFVNLREDWRGHLWQERFASVPMDERHLHAAWRYVELNPVRAGLVKRPEDWLWSSARAHLTGQEDGLTALAPAAGRIADWRSYLGEGLEDEDRNAIRQGEKDGRPLGSAAFISELSSRTGYVAPSRNRGRPKINRDSN